MPMKQICMEGDTIRSVQNFELFIVSLCSHGHRNSSLNRRLVYSCSTVLNYTRHLTKTRRNGGTSMHF